MNAFSELLYTTFTPFNRIFSLSFTGALDTWTVNIVPKNLSKNGRYQSQSILKCISKPFEQTFRLQVIFYFILLFSYIYFKLYHFFMFIGAFTEKSVIRISNKSKNAT